MSFVTDLQQFQDSRRMPDWKPKKANASRAIAKTNEDRIKEQVVKRCLSFIDLEIQVQQWVDNIRQEHPELPPEEAEALELHLSRNSADEQKHEKALQYLAAYYGGAYSDNTSTDLLEAWTSLDCNPIVAAYALECGVFFTILPLLMTCGDIYAATVGQWVNDDERVHVETNLRVMKRLGLTLNNDVLKLVYLTVKYIYQPYGEDRAIAEAARAVKRVTSGRDKQMLRESLPVTTAFFEQHTKQAIVY
jgi:hypothetical protein